MNSLKQLSHHVRHTRPAWYQSYHQWRHHGIIHWTVLIAATAIIFFIVVNLSLQYSGNQPKGVQAATTDVSQTVNAGTLSLSAPGSTTLSAVTTSTSSQNSTGTLGVTTVTDTRGSGAGWSLTDTSTNFTVVNAAVKVSGSNNTVTSGGTYASNTAGAYTVTIATGGAVGTATFDVSGLETDTNVTTGAGVAVGTHGVTATFATATYVTGDSWTIRIDVIPVTGFQQTPGSVTTVSGSSTGVTGGSAHTFSSTADSATVVSATSGNGMGQYTVNPALQLTIPANSYANTYSATITETLS